MVDLSSSPGINDTLARAEAVILPSQASLARVGPLISSPAASPFGVPEGGSATRRGASDGELYAGVDLGIAYLVLVVLDQPRQPLAGEFQFAEVVRDGLVVDFSAANNVLHLRRGAIIARHITGQPVDALTLVGGATAFPGMAGVIQEYTGLPTQPCPGPCL